MVISSWDVPELGQSVTAAAGGASMMKEKGGRLDCSPDLIVVLHDNAVVEGVLLLALQLGERRGGCSGSGVREQLTLVSHECMGSTERMSACTARVCWEGMWIASGRWRLYSKSLLFWPQGEECDGRKTLEPMVQAEGLHGKCKREANPVGCLDAGDQFVSCGSSVAPDGREFSLVRDGTYSAQ
ncbi:hypothetical protein BOTBODRAFT_47776 [Botryobasidium botryosum FD-172 SS1]|uniref:Uncharacterized protein n=1 Tax=Botryobasidium botryosum (strain FD-172 SS1) TaxID=930990 RepID=A0A067MCB2_BOTB1|nr:hypothetical protein BOTBODRAFT_47776 [Botryobasidium botryosum FD-172 SS1]